ncbi:major facilitator superfamily domain-containing protein [Echria macrotheca]|uniref:Major facilitator superfamily domain-containing protein n=1 Tax=Echria macrotheca TaxID=438768 RepID=A0AAJ0F1V5_9PEZI|nr:major facilitator superfamily domain-containing protein [Echria macrotheca]
MVTAKAKMPEESPEALSSGEGTVENPDARSDKDATAKDTAEEFEYISGMRLFLVMGSITLVGFLMLLDMSIISTAIPRITTEFKSIQDVGWYGSAYNLSSAALQPLTGKIYTYFKAKWSFISFLAIFALGSLVCGVAQSSAVLVVGRAIAGLGTSGLQNGAMTIISNCIPFEKRPAYLGILMGCSQLGIVTGPLIGGAITQYSTWRWCFYLNLPAAAVVSGILVICHIPERPVKTDRSVFSIVLSEMDLSGFAIFAPSAVMFLMGLEFGGREHPWNSATVIGLLVGSAVGFVLFFVWEHRQGDKAMFPLAMIKKREVWTSMMAGMLLMGGIVFPAAFYLPIYFQTVKGASPFMSGVDVLPNILGTTVFAVLSGVLVRKTRYYVPWVLFSAVLSSIASGLLTTLQPDTSTGKWIGYQILLSARGACIQMPLVAVQLVLPQEQLSIAMALLVFSNTFGGAVFLTIVQTIFANHLASELAQKFSPTQVAGILSAGARGIPDVVSGDALQFVLQAYSDSVDLVFYVPLASAICLFVVAWGMGWHDITKKGGPPGSVGQPKDEEKASPSAEVPKQGEQNPGKGPL